jgi:hypothetical protein
MHVLVALVLVLSSVSLADTSVPAPRKSTPGKVTSAAPATGCAAHLPVPRCQPKHNDCLDDLLEGNCCDCTWPENSDRLEKCDIVNGMSRVKAAVAACYLEHAGMAAVNVTISPAGCVTSAVVGGAFAGTKTGTCVEAAVQKAVFPSFAGPPMTLTYPFMFR